MRWVVVRGGRVVGRGWRGGMGGGGGGERRNGGFVAEQRGRLLPARTFAMFSTILTSVSKPTLAVGAPLPATSAAIAVAIGPGAAGMAAGSD